MKYHIPTKCSARSRKLSTRTVCITESSRNPVHSRFGRRISETTQGSISTKCTWCLEIIIYLIRARPKEVHEAIYEYATIPFAYTKSKTKFGNSKSKTWLQWHTLCSIWKQLFPHMLVCIQLLSFTFSLLVTTGGTVEEVPCKRRCSELNTCCFAQGNWSIVSWVKI